MLTARKYLWGKRTPSTDDVEMQEASGSGECADVEDSAEQVRFMMLCLHIKC